MTTIRKTILALALASVIASSAQAAQTLVAGWDFSQFDPDVMTSQINGTMINQVYSNVSYLDEVDHIIGPNDDGYGMLYYDGQFGSDALIDASNVDSRYLYVSPGVLGGLELEIPEYDSSSTNSADYIAKKLAAGQFQVKEAVIVLLPQDYSGVSEFNLVFSVHVDAGDAGESWTLKYDTLTFGMAAGVEPTETVQIDWACATDPEGTWTPLGTDTIGARTTIVHEVPESFDGVSTIYFRVHAVAVSDISNSPMIDNVSIFAEVEAGPETFDPTKPFDGVAYDATNRPGYYYSPWFGWYYSQEEWTNWYYQFNGMGWIWTNSAASTEVYFWNPSLPFTCWAYTAADSFPWVVVWGAPNVPTDGWYHFNASNNSLTQ